MLVSPTWFPVPPPSTRFPAIGHQWSSVSSPAAISLVESFQSQASDWCGHWSHWSVLTTPSFPLVSGDHRDGGQGLPANFPQPISTSSSTTGMVTDFAQPILFHSSTLHFPCLLCNFLYCCVFLYQLPFFRSVSHTNMSPLSLSNFLWWER